MGKEEMSFLKKVLNFFSKLLLLVVVVAAFYKLPGIVAEKISYWKLKNKNIIQNFGGED